MDPNDVSLALATYVHVFVEVANKYDAAPIGPQARADYVYAVGVLTERLANVVGMGRAAAMRRIMLAHMANRHFPPSSPPN